MMLHFNLQWRKEDVTRSTRLQKNEIVQLDGLGNISSFQDMYWCILIHDMEGIMKFFYCYNWSIFKR